MANETDRPEDVAGPTPVSGDLPSLDSPVTQSVPGLDDDDFEVPSGRYLGLFSTVGAVVGLAVGIQSGNLAFAMAIGLAIGFIIGLVLNAYTTR